jgi:hypothetical protein
VRLLVAALGLRQDERRKRPDRGAEESQRHGRPHPRPALRFEVTSSDGTRTLVSKRERGWRKNVPDFWTLEPGDSVVYDVFLASDAWKNVPMKAEGTPLALTAVLEVRADASSREHGVFTGEVSSDVRTYVLRR